MSLHTYGRNALFAFLSTLCLALSAQAQNGAPSAWFHGLNNNDVLLTGARSLGAGVSDPQGDADIKRLIFKYDGVVIANDSVAPYTANMTLTTGSHTVQVTAYDLAGLSGGQTFTIIGNNSPTIAVASVQPSSDVATGQAVTISCTPQDSDGSISKVEYWGQFNGNWIQLGQTRTSAPWSTTHTFGTTGWLRIQAKTWDNYNAFGQALDVWINVVAGTGNQVPTATLTAPSAAAVLQAGATTLAANAADADGTISKVEFFVDGIKVGEDLTSAYTIGYTPSTGNHTAYAKATDNGGAVTQSATNSFRVNAAPSVALSAPADVAVVAAGALSLQATASDGDGSISKVEFFVNGSKVGEDLTSPYAYSYTVAAGNFTWYAKATDNDGATAQTATRSFLSNQPPTVVTASPASNAVVATGSVTLTATASDPDGSVAKVEFFEGSTLLATDNAAPFSQAVTLASGTHTITMKATDNLGATASASIYFVCNQAPTITLTQPTNSATLEAGNIYLKANATDADGNIVSVDFYVDGQLAGSDAVPPFEYKWTASNGAHAMYAKVTDDLGFATNSATANVTVVNPSTQVFFSENFDAGAGQVFIAYNSPNRWQWWAASYANGIGGTACLHSKLPFDGDYWATPMLTGLSATKEYSFILNVSTGAADRRWRFYLNTTQSLAGAIKLDSFAVNNSNTWSEQILKFSPPSDGNWYLMVNHSGSNYSHLYVDNVSFERNVVPSVAMTAPANNGSSNESLAAITLTANASDDGQVIKVEFYDGATLVGTDNTAPYAFDWINYLPGVHSLTAKAYDNRGNTNTSAPVVYTVKFDDGTGPSSYVHWSFNNLTGGSEPWTVTGAQYENCGSINVGYNNTNGLYYFVHEQGGYFHSPKLFLQGSQAYSWQWRPSSKGNTIEGKWYYNTVPSMAGATLFQTLTFNQITAFAKQTASFTPPANGAYYILFQPTGTGYVKFYLDELRLVGPINSAPAVAIMAPTNNTVIAEGADLIIKANASDPDGSVARVLFYAGSTYLGKDSVAPYALETTSLAPGNYNLTVVAYDNAGGFTISTPVNVTVNANKVLTASYLGGSGSTDAVRGSVVAADGTIVLAANIGDATPGGLTAALLGGATASSGGAIIRLGTDGKTVTQVVRLASIVLDLAQDSVGNLYVACGPDGVKKLNPAATSQLFAQTFTDNAFRVDAGRSGHFAVLTRPSTDYDAEQTTGVAVFVFNAANTQTASYPGATTWCSDVAVDSKSGTVVTIGTKNFNTYDGGGNTYPVYVPVYKGHSFTGSLKYTGYDWSNDQADPRWLNKFDNNMADVKAERCAIGQDGLLYIAYEVAGGNHIMRYDPFVNGLSVPNTASQTGDNFAIWSNTTTAPKIFVGRHRPADGSYILGAQFTPRLPNGLDNTVRTKNGELAADRLGRVFVAYESAYGLPINLEYLPGAYLGGAGVVMFSPDLVTRELVTRYTTGGIARTVAIGASGRFVIGGSVVAQDLFTYQPVQATMQGTQDGFVVTADYSGLYSWNPAATHPRLFFNASELAAHRAKKTTAPFSTMLAKMNAIKNMGQWGTLAFDSTAIYDVGVRIQHYAFLYAIEQNEAYAQEARKWVTKMINSGFPGEGWANPNLKGLTSFWMAKHVSQAYDWCFNSPSWDEYFRYTVSSKLKVMADMIAVNGGTEQSTDDASNWQGIRGSSALLSYLALDHPQNPTQYEAMWSKLTTYINANLGTAATSKGWNVEGTNYTAYPWGNFVSPAGIALRRLDVAKDIRSLQSVRNTFWSMVAAHSTAINGRGYGSIHPDWTDDDPNGNCEGVNGQGFYFVDSTILPQYKWAYDRLQGASSPYQLWDMTRAGAVWSYLYYPASTTAADPMASADWKARFKDDQNLGLMTFRNAYANADDHIAQFKVKLRTTNQAHDGPDGLGYRIIGAGTCWVTGGGRNAPGNFTQQPALYYQSPLLQNGANRNLGSFVGSPLVGSSGGGHALGFVNTDNQGVNNHKRWFVANYNSAATGADAVYIIGDESNTSNSTGIYWQLPTYAGNTVAITGSNTFTITAPNGAVAKGTVLYPTASPQLATGRTNRGSAFGDSARNAWVQCQSSNGAYLVVLTIKKTGSQPAVSYSGTGITGSTVTVGSATFQLNATDVIYGGGSSPRIGVDEALASLGQAGLMLWPNPAKGSANLALTGLQDGTPAEATLTDVTGRVVLRRSFAAGQTLRLDIPGAATGIYQVQVHAGSETIRQRLVVE